MTGSCLELLPTLSDHSFDGIVTSPPYANRYDYTRTYALELALMGIDENGVRQLRQEMLSCTVENRVKADLITRYPEAQFKAAACAFENQKGLGLILRFLEICKANKTLNNTGIPRMIQGYFFEMAQVIFECARLLKPQSPLIMVNDNVQYQGVHLPVDLILSDFAVAAGFEIENIWVLPRGKGNSSQQMGLHGREEIRKCVYLWQRL